MDSPIIVLTDGYLGKSTITSELAGYQQNVIELVAIDYEDLTQTQEIVSGLDGYVICLSGPGAFSYERALLFSYLAQNKNVTDAFPMLFEGKCKVGKWSWISAGAIVDASASIGAMSVVLDGANLGKFSTVGNFCWVDESVHIGSGASVERHVTLLPKARLGINSRVTKNSEINKDIMREETVGSVIDTNLFGARAVLIP